jgi:SMODS and SLOG-associating 2TM effector domain 3
MGSRAGAPEDGTESRASVRTATSPAAVEDDRIALVFRVGVTGHRWMPKEDEAARLAVGAALQTAFARCSNRSTEWTSVEKAVVSSLADGADRLAAEWAVDHGLRLEVILPLEPEAYLEDFDTDESQADFHRLVGSADAVTVVPPQDTRDDAYRTAGRAVAERSDVLLAVWDGQPAKGVGGTGEIVATAGRLGVPVLWLRSERHRDGPATYLPVDVADAPVPSLRAVSERAGPLSDSAFRLLDIYNRTVLPPNSAAPLEPTDDPTARQLASLYQRADLIAVRARDSTLRASRSLYTLAVVAVAIAAGQLVFFSEHVWLVWFEFVALVLILGILLRARRSRLLDRWISTRTLAERLRSGYHLALIGASPVLGTMQIDAEASTPATEWTERALREASLRTAARTRSNIDLETGRSLLLQQWLDPQLVYQRQVMEAATKKQHLSNRVTITLFGISLLACVLHVLQVLKPEGAPEYWTYLSIVVPAAAAAVSGYTAQREYLRQRLRAGTMVRRLAQGRASVVRAATVPELRRAAEAVDLVMQGESADWFSATRLHELEIP